MHIDDLLEIPDFLRRDPAPLGTVPEREPKRSWIMPKAKSKPKSKRKNKRGPNISEGDRYILRSLGWSDKVLKAMPRKDIEAILNKPRKILPIDEVTYLQKGGA